MGRRAYFSRKTAYHTEVVSKKEKYLLYQNIPAERYFSAGIHSFWMKLL